MAEFQRLELDPTQTFCFGFCPFKPKNGRCGDNGWYKLTTQSITKGWKNSDIRRIGNDLKTNINATFGFLCQTVMNDLDSGMKYKVMFENSTSLWKMGVVDSPGAEILPEQAAEFFAADYMKKFANRCGLYIAAGVKCINEILMPHIENGELLQVPEPKLAAIMFWAQNDHVMQNLRELKYRLI